MIQNTGKGENSYSSSSMQISQVKNSWGSHYIWIEGTKFEIDPFSDEENLDRWFSGQRVKIGKNDDLMYDVSIHNLDYNETVHARKIG